MALTMESRDQAALHTSRAQALLALTSAAGLGMGWDIPVIGVNHLRGHLRSADLEEQRVEYPAIILLVSSFYLFLQETFWI